MKTPGFFKSIPSLASIRADLSANFQAHALRDMQDGADIMVEAARALMAHGSAGSPETLAVLTSAVVSAASAAGLGVVIVTDNGERLLVAANMPQTVSTGLGDILSAAVRTQSARP